MPFSPKDLVSAAFEGLGLDSSAGPKLGLPIYSLYLLGIRDIGEESPYLKSIYWLQIGNSNLGLTSGSHPKPLETAQPYGMSALDLPYINPKPLSRSPRASCSKDPQFIEIAIYQPHLICHPEPTLSVYSHPGGNRI